MHPPEAEECRFTKEIHLDTTGRWRHHASMRCPLRMLLFLAILPSPTTSAVIVKDAAVFTAGRDGYDTFRIPALIEAPDGTLLAFAEGRVGGRGDSGNIDLVLKRSRDGGSSWGELEVVWDDDANTCGNPCPVVDHETSVIHLLATRNLGQDTESEIIAQTSDGPRTVWTLRSEDGGKTWSTPREVTSTVKRADWTWYATGPGNGIQLRSGEHAGRLLIPCDHIEAGTKHYYSHCIASDDHGKTWGILLNEKCEVSEPQSKFQR